jgi:tetratricopeptide (TPR) repeat protein
MSLPDDVISLLRDEAYLDLCRNALKDALERIVEEKQQVTETRPPFGILASKKQREEFEMSMQTVLDTETAIEARLGKLEAIENWLKSAIRERLREYLKQASENYRRSGKIAEAIKAWDRLIEHYGEQLLALARNIKNVSVSFAGAAGGARSAFGDRAQAFAELRMGADSLDRTAVQLESLTRTMAMYAANSAYKDVELPELPIKGVVGWVDNLALQHDRDALPAAQEMESDARAVVAKKLGEYHTAAQTAVESLSTIETQELESYWEVLRAHALAHYVQERDVDEVLNELNERYVVANIERRQRAIESQLDPYGHER